eukprot:15453539-Alexandrium_andersonii.AAC.1
MDQQVLLLWATAEGWTMPQCCRALNLNASTADKYMDVVRGVLALDVQQRLQHIQFGCLPDGTMVDVEADETQ